MSHSILVIDDEKNVRNTLKQCLEEDGHEVEAVVNGQEGIDRFTERSYDLVLLDMKLPDMDGMDVLRRLKHARPAADLIMITAFGTIESAVEAMKLGACDYLSKPFSPRQIRDEAQSVLNRSQLREESLEGYGSYLEFAKRCISNQLFDKAMQYLKQAVEADPFRPEPFNLLGVLYEMRGRMEDARRSYRAAYALDPSYGPAQHNLYRVTELKYSPTGMDLGEETPGRGTARDSKG